MRQIAGILVIVALMTAVGCRRDGAPRPRATEADGFVRLEDGRFMIGDSVWFPLMVNYCVELRGEGDSLSFVPAPYYGEGSIADHLATIAGWGFNSVRLCADRMGDGDVGRACGAALRQVAMTADSLGLRLMVLIRPPFDARQRRRTAAMLVQLADCPAVWAYDFMNEPLYFDPEPYRTKDDAVKIVGQWRRLMEAHAPHQLFTVGQAEPIEVFEWDPSLLPVDFVELHTYHPLRVASEMYWYSRYVGRPWIVGETSLPADGDSVPLSWQATFMKESFACALRYGAIGYGWWEFQDFPGGVNFEAQFSGLRTSEGVDKPAAAIVKELSPSDRATSSVRPVNFYNMLFYSNIVVTGTVTDPNGRPIEGAVVRGWNDDWSVGMNTYTDPDGRFELWCNALCVHFEVSAAGWSKAKFDAQPQFDGEAPDLAALPAQEREYQSIDYRQYLLSDSSLLTLDSSQLSTEGLRATIPPVRLRK